MTSVFIVFVADFDCDIIREVFSTKEKATEYTKHYSQYSQEKFNIVEYPLDPAFTKKLQTQIFIDEDGKIEDVQQYYFGFQSDFIRFEQRIIHKVPTWSGTQTVLQWYALFQLTESDKDKAIQFAKDCVTKIIAANAWADDKRANHICFDQHLPKVSE